jgi:hypothetical protein
MLTLLKQHFTIEEAKCCIVVACIAAAPLSS